MALNASGPISLGGATTGESINLELGQSATAQVSLNDASVRGLAGVASGAISFGSLYGKSSVVPAPYSDDVFSTYTYDGTGSYQTVTNGIDISNNGGLVWSACRSHADGSCLKDSARGVSNQLVTSSSAGQIGNIYGATSFMTTGFEAVGDNLRKYISWTFRNAPKFFDVVTYTGDGVETRQIPHALGVVPGFIVCKRIDSTSDWGSYFSNTVNVNYTGLNLNSTAAATMGPSGGASEHSATSFKPGRIFTVAASAMNITGHSYVAYLFAHDTAADGIIKCGSYTSDSGGNATVTLGWEPQYVLVKPTSVTGNWSIFDSARGFPTKDVTVGRKALFPNSTAAETEQAGNGVSPTSTGFVVTNYVAANATWVYMAIRRPNKPPTSGAQVFYATNNQTVYRNLPGQTALPIDLVILRNDRNSDSGERKWWWADRLRGFSPNAVSLPILDSSSTAVEVTPTYGTMPYLDGFDISFVALQTTQTDVTNWTFRRAPGVFDIVCYTGNGAASRSVNHNLTVAPQLAIFKTRNSTTGQQWNTFYYDGSNAALLSLHNTSTNRGFTNTAGLTSTVVKVGTTSGELGASATDMNTNSINYVAYLFATKAGVSKVGFFNYITGTNHNVDCGFSSGARFALIKSTNNTGDWWIYDSTRGITTGNDPFLSLNTTNAEVTTNDGIDPLASGFTIASTGSWQTGVYIYLAFA